ncbi:hypothetical protein D1007_45757 [Hordeum vulgare]|uniref:uncharacterized protein LOC123443266 n=1 Tax=Hordeum vulgare subsp. vulgare TaxID=112509 RepID=UPI00162C5014|nr:uncharacterized protein LOC123443266 [Hordeum vulgare subsp. vulgare]KAE8781004.1 hypothetical protein D1007_45757 [Hordeum vulgare]
MALRFFLKKTYHPLARSGDLLHASARAAAAAAPAAGRISTTRYLSMSPCHHAAAAKISNPKTGMPSININYMKSVLVDSSRRSMQTSSTRATMINVEPSSASQLAESGASYRRFLKNVRLFACGLSLVWAITLYSVWSKQNRCPCNCQCRHSKSSNMKRGGQVV